MSILDEAVWHVDAASVMGDLLLDHSGNGRHAKFGTGAAAPIVLPHDGEDYVWLPEGSGNRIHRSVSIPSPVSDVAVAMRADLNVPTTQVQIISLSGTDPGKWVVLVRSDGSVWSRCYDTSGVLEDLALTADMTALRPWLRLSFASGVVTLEDSDDGAAWAQVGQVAHTGARTSLGAGAALNAAHGAYVAGSAAHKVYRATWVVDGQTYSWDASDDLLGSAWTITRADSGFKTAVVDRPLLLFGGGQQAKALSPATIGGDMTAIVAIRDAGRSSGAGCCVLYGRLNGDTATGLVFQQASSGVQAYAAGSHGYTRTVSTRPEYAKVWTTRVSGGANEWRTDASGWIRNTGSATGDGIQVDEPLYIGASGNTINPAYAGEFEFIAAAIFDRALTDQEVELATLALLVPATGLPVLPVHRTYDYPTQAAPPNNSGEYNQFASVLQVNRYGDSGNDIEADLFGATDVPMTLTSDGGSDSIVAPLIDYAGNGHIRINGAGTDSIHTIAGVLTITAQLPADIAPEPPSPMPVPDDPILDGPRYTRFRYELLGPAEDSREGFLGELATVVGGSLTWKLTSAVKGGGTMTVRTTATSPEIDWLNYRVRPVVIVLDEQGNEAVEQPLGVFVPAAPVENWTPTGRVWEVELLDKNSLLNQDIATDDEGNPVSYSLLAGTNVVQAVTNLIALINEQDSVLIEPSGDVLRKDMTWDAGTPLLQIINNVLQAADYDSLWCDGLGRYRSAPHVLQSRRGAIYPDRPPFVPGASAVRTASWELDRDIYDVPNRMVAISTADEGEESLVAVEVNQNPDSPFSYQARGRWITVVDKDIDVTTQEALQAYCRRRMTMLTSTAARATVKHLWLPDLTIGSIIRFTDPAAGMDGLFEVRETTVVLDPLALASTIIEEVVAL